MRYGPMRRGSRWSDSLFAEDRSQSFRIGWTVIALATLLVVGCVAGLQA